MSKIEAIIFDLDGTLIASADSVLSSFAAAFDFVKWQPVRALNPSVIGPPLLQALKILSGSDDQRLLAQLADAFKVHYDSEGYKATRAYAGTEDMLARLCAAGLPLYVATNKRHVPTERIIDLLGWRDYFKATVSLDTPQLSVANKGALIRYLLDRFELQADTVLYVGDRYEDGVAAEQAGTGFFYATWGYESGSVDTLPPLSGDMDALAAYLHSHGVFVTPAEPTNESVVELVNRAQALSDVGHNAAAIAAYQSWLRQHDAPNAYAAWFNLAVLYTNAGKTGLAQAALRQCLKRSPDFAPAVGLCRDQLLDGHRAMAARASYGHARLRIGWLGSAAALRANPLTSHANRAITTDYEHCLFGWGLELPATVHDINALTDGEAACLIRAGEIDVLIDLMGWSEQARPGIVAYHPGSLQLTWTLVPEPSGLAAVDGVIADGSMLTQKQVPEFAEAVHWLEPAHPVIGESLASFQKRVEQLIGNVHAKLPHRTVWTPLPAQTLQYLSAPRGLGRRYVIVAPPFEHASAGIRVLYDLQKWLTLAGLDAIVCTYFNGYPIAQFSEDIVIYPEVAPGNLLKAKRVIRYLLNIPGKLGHGEPIYADNEILVAYNQDLAPYADGLVLQVPSIEPYFHANDCNKTLNTFYVGKGRNLGLHPADCVEITKTFPASRPEVAELLRKTNILYSYDHFTMLAAEAKLCGCQVILIQPDGSFQDCPPISLPSEEKFKQQLHQFIEISRTL